MISRIISRKIQSLGKTDVNVNTNYISIDDEREDYILFTADDKVQKLNPIVRSAYNSYHSLSIYANENGYPINNIAIPYTGQEVGSVDCEECDEGKIECESCVGDGTYTCPYCNE